MLFGQIIQVHRVRQEVTPHEGSASVVGHGAGGLRTTTSGFRKVLRRFAAALFLQRAVGPKWQKDYIEFWERQRVRILEKIISAFHRNDAATMAGKSGSFLRAPAAYQGELIPRAAYVLSMLRS